MLCRNNQYVKEKYLTEHNKKMEWWREAHFGMFIHWWLYAVPAGEWKGKQVPGISEWIMEREEISVKNYENLAKELDPVKL